MNLSVPGAPVAKLAAVLATAILIGCGSESPTAVDDYVHRVKAIPAVLTDSFEVPRRFSGLVSPRQSTSLSFEAAGELERLSVDEGDPVSAGQVIAVLDTRLLDDQKRRFEAQKRDLRSRLKLAGKNLDRAKALRSDGFTSERDVDQLETDLTSLQTQLVEVEAALRSNATRLRKSELRAPFAATISRRHQDEGAVVNPGEPVFTLLENEGLEVRVGVPVRLLGQLQSGDAVTVEVHGREMPGQILTVGTDVARATLTVPLRVALPENVDVVAGDQAALRFAELQYQEGYWLPATAITDGLRGLWNIYVLASTDVDDRYLVEARDVRVEYADADRVYVSGAVVAGELVLTGGLHRVVPGQHVRLAIEESVAQQ